MADKEITDLTAASDPDGTELVHVDQSGNSRKMTTQQVADLLPSFRGCKATLSANLTGQNATGAGIDIAWSAEDFDSDSFHSTSSNTERLTIPAAFNGCIVEVNASIFTTDGSADDYVNVSIEHRNSGGTLLEDNDQSTEVGFGAPRTTVSSGPVSVATGDYFLCHLSAESDTSLTVVAQGSFFSIKVLGTAP